MKLTDAHIATSTRIDDALRDGDFTHVPLVDGGRTTRYIEWYARLLTTLTLVVEEQVIQYSQTDYDVHQGTVRFVLFTEQSVIVVEGNDLTEDQPTVVTRIVGRSSLTSLSPTASMRLDQEGSAAHGWPGRVKITAHYPGLATPLLLAAMGHDSYNPNEPSPILALLVALQEDLDSRS